jgi:hypothetical protein
MYKILEKYSQLKVEQNFRLEEDKQNLLQLEEDVLKNFLNLYDRDVKAVHYNQELIEKDIQTLYKETDKLTNTTKAAVEMYDNFLQYLKEAGDIVNWCSMIEDDMCKVYDHIAAKQREHYAQEKNV